MVDREARKRIQALEERAVQRDRETVELSGRLSRLAATVEAIRASQVPGAPSSAAARDPPPPQAPPRAPSAVALSAAPAGFASLIVPDFPALFAEFRGKHFTLLWRGSRDGFGARDFHGRCDGHAPTLTLIQDTKGSIFGGFRPVQWESCTTNSPYWKADSSLKSFLFTLKNPHNLPARQFAPKPENQNQTILCHSWWGPCFGGIWVSDNSNAGDGSWSSVGRFCANDTGRCGNTVFTGWRYFRVKEIEVFEIAD
jgi:hypothetical protein